MFKNYFANKIYHLKKEEDLEYLLNKNKKYWKYALHYLSIINDYNKIYDFIKEHINLNLDEKTLNMLNYYLCAYYFHNKEVYSTDKIYYKLNEIHKVKMDINKCNYSNELCVIFDNKFIPRFRYFKLFKKYGNTFHILYLNNFLRESYYYRKSINRIIVTKLKMILIKNELSIADIDYLGSIISITNCYYSLTLDKVNNYPIDKKILKKITYKLTDNIDCYKDILGKTIIKYNELIVLGFRTLITLDDDIDNQKEYLQLVNSFIESHDLNEYTKFIYKISNQLKNGKQDVNEYINNIKKIASGKMNGEILHLIYVYCTTVNNIGELKSFYNSIKDIECLNVNDNIKSELSLGKNILKFWCGEKIDSSSLDGYILQENFLKLIIDFDNGIINYDELLQKLDTVNSIDCLFILNWERLGIIFNKYNYKWLEAILKKCNNTDYKFKNYLLSIYLKLINRKEYLILNDFEYFDNIVLSKINNLDFKVLSVLIHLIIYNDYDENVKNNINIILSNYQDIKLKTDLIELFISSIIIYGIKDNILISEIDSLKKLINKYLNGNKETLSLLGTYYLDNIPLEFEEYLSLLKNVYDIYIGNSEIKDYIEFSLVASLARKNLETKELIKAKNQDIIYIDNKIDVVLENDIIDDYQELYDKLGIKKVNSILNGKNKTTMLEIMIDRIYFENIEKYHAGKKISFSSDLKGKELMNELLNAIGYQEEQKVIKQIKNGNLIEGLWLNNYNLHQYIKDIKSKNDMKFSNSVNGLIGIEVDNVIIHITSLVLLAKLGIVDKLPKLQKYRCTGKVLNEIEKMKQNGTYDLIDGVIEEAVCYDDYLDDMYTTLIDLDNSKQIEYISSANILGIKDVDKINEFDLEFLKLMTTYKNKPFIFITEDPFYFKTEFLNNISYGTYSLIIDMYVNSIIDSQELYELTKKLNEFNYNLFIKRDAYNYLITKSNDIYISNTIDILNKYN